MMEWEGKWKMGKWRKGGWRKAGWGDKDAREGAAAAAALF